MLVSVPNYNSLSLLNCLLFRIHFGILNSDFIIILTRLKDRELAFMRKNGKRGRDYRASFIGQGSEKPQIHSPTQSGASYDSESFSLAVIARIRTAE